MTTNTEQVTSKPGRRETPTSTLVLSVDAPRAEWLAARRHGITATDLPALLGLSQYRTAIDVWTDKVMEPEDREAGEAAFWGTRLEEPVAQAWAERKGVKIRRVGIVANQDVPWAMASLDRLVSGCPDGRCALEVKTRSLFVSDAWEKELPADVAAQVMWQLAVTGLDHIHVAALIGGQRLVEHVVRPDEDEIARLASAAMIVWDAVRAGVMPDMPAHFWTSDYVEARHQNREGAIELGEAARPLVAEYEAASAMESLYKEQKAAARTQLVGLLGAAETATIGGKTAYTFKASTTRRLDSKALAAKYPDIALDDDVHSTTTSRTLRITNQKEPK